MEVKFVMFRVVTLAYIEVGADGFVQASGVSQVVRFEGLQCEVYFRVTAAICLPLSGFGVPHLPAVAPAL